MAKKLSKKDKQLKEVQQHLSDGLEYFAIQENMGLGESELRSLVGEVLENLAGHIQDMPIEHVYAQFVLDGHSIIQSLKRTAVASEAPRDAISAYKAMWEVRKDLLDTGKKFGILKPDIRQIQEGAIGINLQITNDMNIEDLMVAARDVIVQVDHLEKKLGNKQLSIVENKTLFSGPSVFELESSEVSEKVAKAQE